MKQILDKFFPAFAETPRVKPDNMLYVAQEAPDRVTAVLASVQHVIVVLMLVVFTAICGQESGLSANEIRGFVAMEIIVIGLTTLLQASPTPRAVLHGGAPPYSLAQSRLPCAAANRESCWRWPGRPL